MNNSQLQYYSKHRNLCARVPRAIIADKQVPRYDYDREYCT